MGLLVHNRSKQVSAVTFVLLMLAMSFSASMQAWQFLDDAQTPQRSGSTTYSSATLIKGFFGTVPTNVSNSQSGGTYEFDAGPTGLSFAEDGFNRSTDAVGIGNAHMCAILQGGLYCTGDNAYGQLGIGTTDDQDQFVKVDLGAGRTAVSVSAGSFHTCAVLDDGSLKCWGYNGYGRLGLGSTTQQTTPQSVSLGTGRTAVSVSAGDSHTCAVLDDGSLKCWGRNNYGQLGIGSTTQQTSPSTVFLGTGRTPVSVSAGSFHTCAVLDDGSLKCWGYNGNGRLGLGSTTQQTTPQSVSLGTGRTAVSVSAGNYHTCAVLDDGSLKCWGANGSGRLGLGSTTQQTTPQSVSLGTGRTAVSVSAGSSHTCAVLDDGSLKCWGYNFYGQLGLGSTTQQTTPQSVVGMNSTDSAIFTSRSSQYAPTCAFNDGSLYCWGAFFSSTSQKFLSPQKMQPANSGSESLGLGSGHTCLVDGADRLKCLGRGSYGQLGRNDTSDSMSAMSPYGLEDTDVTSVSAGYEHTCAVLDDGSLKCWGSNGNGQLGIGSTTQQTTPQSVSLGTGRTAVSVNAGYYHTCAVLDDGSLKCWGSNGNGQLGIGSTTQQTTPQSVSLGTGRTAVSVSAGSNHACAVLDDGSLKCWGSNGNGQLGLGSTTQQTTPQSVSLGTGRTAVSVSAGYQHTCAVLDDGSLKCWGYNGYGQLGLGSTTQQTTPQSVSLGTGRTAVSVSAGYRSHLCGA